MVTYYKGHQTFLKYDIYDNFQANNLLWSLEAILILEGIFILSEIWLVRLSLRFDNWANQVFRCNHIFMTLALPLETNKTQTVDLYCSIIILKLNRVFSDTSGTLGIFRLLDGKTRGVRLLFSESMTESLEMCDCLWCRLLSRRDLKLEWTNQYI